ncbi:MAG: DNA-binding protein [Desulfuromonadaceae bacterium]|nr:DNA-binding protein [Desulfuromonadaceae bacterium]MDD2854846.1 DNA-binding protein [Desulfuromonadaceae bacterium]
MKQVLFILIALAMISASVNNANAFWGSERRYNPSGLDVTAGYDVNTVTTIHGTVITPPAKAEQGEHTQMAIATEHGTAIILLGPWSFWEKQAFTVALNEEIYITGSRAQGKDGSVYIFAQRIENGTSGVSVMLRSANGAAVWSHGGRSATGSARGSSGGTVQRYGNRGGTGGGYRSGMNGGGRR